MCEDKRIRRILRRIVDYYTATRAVGHTHIACGGAPAATQKPMILVHSREWGKQLTKRYSHLRAVCISDLETCLLGERGPLIIDNYALQLICSEALLEIDRLRMTLSMMPREEDE